MEETFLSAIECTVHRFNDIRQTELHTAEPLVPETRAFEFKLAIEEPKKVTNHQILIKYQENWLK